MIIWFKNFRFTILWGGLVLLLFLTPGQHFPKIPDFYDLFQPDKLIHLFLFGVFLYLMLQSVLKQYGCGFLRYRGIIIALTTGIFLGALTEVLQHSLDINRSGNYYDFIVNVTGCFLGLLAFNTERRKKNRKS